MAAKGNGLAHGRVCVGALQSFLDQLEGSGGSAKVPPGVLRVLASKACHSAIRCPFISQNYDLLNSIAQPQSAQFSCALERHRCCKRCSVPETLIGWMP